MNMMMPAAGNQPAAPALHLPTLDEQHSAAAAKLAKVDEVAARARAARQQFDHLMALGDLVEEDDLVSAAGRVIAAGGDPIAIASLLADAPQGSSQALSQWIGQQDQQFKAKEQQLAAAQAVIRHQAGLAALRLLAGHSFGQTQAPESPAAGPNPMMPSGTVPEAGGLPEAPGASPANALTGGMAGGLV